MKHVFIINPAAGKTDRSRELTAAISAAFAPRGEVPLIEVTQYAGHAVELAARHAQDGAPVTLYACGGDGTLREVAQGAAGCGHCRVAPFPIGTGNDFVRCFGDDAAARFRSFGALLDGGTVTLDLLRVDDRICLNIASAGFDAAVARLAGSFRRLPLCGGRTAYLLALGLRFFTSVKSRYQLEVDGELLPPADYIFAVAANGRYYGGGFKAAPDARPDDGKIDLITVPALSRRAMLGMIGSYRRGEHLEKYPFIGAVRCRRVRVLSGGPMPVNLDGEIIMMQNPAISIWPRAIQLVVPAGCALL